MNRTRAEEVVNASTHFSWFVFSLMSLVWSMMHGYDGLVLHSFGSLLAAFGSTMYHKHDSDDHHGKQAMRSMDKVCIFLFMGFTALSFGFAQGSVWLLLSFFVMFVSLILSALYALNIVKETKSEIYYMILAIGTLMTSLHLLCPWHSNIKTSSALILGLVCYALGYYFYTKDDESKWMHTVWHVLVMMGWAFHCVALSYLST